MTKATFPILIAAIASAVTNAVFQIAITVSDGWLRTHVPPFMPYLWGFCALLWIWWGIAKFIHPHSKETAPVSSFENKGNIAEGANLGQQLSAGRDIYYHPQASSPEHEPRLAFVATTAPGFQWFSLAELFTVHHLGGDAAQYVQIAPIRCAKGTQLWVQFDEIPLLSKAQGSCTVHFTINIGGIKKSYDRTGNLRAIFFRNDAVSLNRAIVTYPVTLKYMWNDLWLEKPFTLTWNDHEDRMSVSPARDSSEV